MTAKHFAYLENSQESVSDIGRRNLISLLVGIAGGVAVSGLSGCATNRDAMKRIRLEDTPEGLLVTLDESILFHLGTADFVKSAEPTIEKLKPFFAKARDKILVQGHTDSTGSASFNQRLSLQRAEKVRASLINSRILPSRIVAKGYGSSKPRVWPERTAEDRQQNRRAEILLPGETIASMNAFNLEDSINSMLDGMMQGMEKAKDAIADTFRKAAGVK